jgi:hypothetical protein
VSSLASAGGETSSLLRMARARREGEAERCRDALFRRPSGARQEVRGVVSLCGWKRAWRRRRCALSVGDGRSGG